MYITKRNKTPLPRCDEILDKLGETNYFSKLDLKTVFHQIRVYQEDVGSGASKTRYGKFEYLVIPFVLFNAPGTFQRLMEFVLNDCLEEFLMIYMDDLLVLRMTEEYHLEHFEIVFSRLRSEKLFYSRKSVRFF